jgi:hypothetical protein
VTTPLVVPVNLHALRVGANSPQIAQVAYQFEELP